MQDQTIRNITQDADWDSYRYDYFVDHTWRKARISRSAVAELGGREVGTELSTIMANRDLIHESTIRKAREQPSSDLLLESGGDVRHYRPPVLTF